MRKLDVVVAGGMRTPFAKAGTGLARRTARELGAHAVRSLLEATSLPEEMAAQRACRPNACLNPTAPSRVFNHWNPE